MNVEEALVRYLEMTDNSVLVAKPPITWGAEAMFVDLTEDYAVPDHVKEAGYKYLLGKEEIENLLPFIKKKKASTRTVAEFIIHYALTDSTPSWIDDIPDQ